MGKGTKSTKGKDEGGAKMTDAELRATLHVAIDAGQFLGLMTVEGKTGVALKFSSGRELPLLDADYLVLMLDRRTGRNATAWLALTSKGDTLPDDKINDLAG